MSVLSFAFVIVGCFAGSAVMFCVTGIILLFFLGHFKHQKKNLNNTLENDTSESGETAVKGPVYAEVKLEEEKNPISLDPNIAYEHVHYI